MIFYKGSILQEKLETEDKTQGGASDSSQDTQEKKVELSDNPKRPESKVLNIGYRDRIR